MSANRPTRRSFLKGPLAVREMTSPAGVSTQPAGDQPTTPATSKAGPLALDRSTLLAAVRRRAMACDWEVQLSATRDDDSMEHVFAALDLVERLENQMTIFRDDSEIIRINRRAADAPVSVEPRLFAMLQLADRVHRETGGVLDITSGPLSEIWGFSRRKGRVPTDEEITAVLARVGMEHVVLDEANQTIAFCRPGVAVNLNSVGKGYALDRMSELLGSAGVDDYLLQGGKSSVLARGHQPGRRLDKETWRQGDKETVELDAPCLPFSQSPGLPAGWPIGLRHPLRPEERLGVFHLRNESLSTSGAGTQFFRHRGRRYGHILNPLTGRPAEGNYSATVIAPTAAEAEAYSTAFYVLGPDKTEDFCADRPDLAALLVVPGSREGEVTLRTFGLDETRWEPLG